MSARITTMVEKEKETGWEARERRCALNVAFRLMFLYPQKKTGQRALICIGLLGCSIPPSGTWWVPTTRVQCVHWSICTNTCRPSSTWGCTTLSFITPQGHCSLGSQWADKHRAEGEGEGKYILGGESGCCFFHKLCWGGVLCSEEEKKEWGWRRFWWMDTCYDFMLSHWLHNGCCIYLCFPVLTDAALTLSNPCDVHSTSNPQSPVCLPCGLSEPWQNLKGWVLAQYGSSSTSIALQYAHEV